MDILAGITDKDLFKKLIVIALFTIIFVVCGAILNFWHPNFSFSKDYTLGSWIFATEFIGWAVILLASYAYQSYKSVALYILKHFSQFS